MSTEEQRVPQKGDPVIVCSAGIPRGHIDSGIITQWNEEQDMFEVTDTFTLEAQQYVMKEYSFYFNEKGDTWFFDHNSHGLKVRR